MSNKIDKLFSRKLSDHSMAPRAEAWSRIESGLSKKNKFVIVWRVAAVFVLLGLLTGSWFYWQGQSDRAVRLATKNLVPNETIPEVTKAPAVTPLKEEPIQQVASNNNQEKKTTPIKEKKKTTQQPQEIINDPDPTLAIVEEPIQIESVTVTQVAKTEKPIVIEFTLAPVPSTKTAIAQASEEKPALKKIWDKALDIKNGDAELGGLRMAKNELFALDFRKDKSKRN
jgi:hypothetical protein